MSKAVIFFAPGLEECEGLLCVDILRRAGVEVTIAAVGGEKIVKSARQISVVADALAEELDYTVFDACILPGGIPGVPNLKADAMVRRVCRDFAADARQGGGRRRPDDLLRLGHGNKNAARARGRRGQRFYIPEHANAAKREVKQY